MNSCKTIRINELENKLDCNKNNGDILVSNSNSNQEVKSTYNTCNTPVNTSDTSIIDHVSTSIHSSQSPHPVSIVNDICATCTHKIIPFQHTISCIQCSLMFHIDCVTDYNDNSSYWCDSCFYRTCINELPYCNEPYVDLSVFLVKGSNKSSQ